MKINFKNINVIIINKSMKCHLFSCICQFYTKEAIKNKTIQSILLQQRSTMLRKKNYKQQQHFSSLQAFTAYAPPTATQPSRKYQVYYKRYRKQQQSQNLYNIIYGNSTKDADKTQSQIVSPKFSEDRTLQLISFDGDIGFLKKYLRKIGKIRQYQTGEGIFKGNKISTAMCVFKFQFDLVKCFRQDYLQKIMDEQSLTHAKTITQDDREQERYQLIQQHLGKQLNGKVEKLKEMKQGGYQVVTDIYGQYRMDFDANRKFVEDLPQLKKQKKIQQKQAKLKEQKQKKSNQN